MRNNRETIIELYFIEKYKPIEISLKLNISKSAVTQVLQTDERYATEKLSRKKANKVKHNENTNSYKRDKRNVNQFKNNVDDLILKSMHRQAISELSKTNKLTNLSYRNWNTSAYKYNSNKKRFEFREELGRSYDVPKYIKVEV